MEQYLWLASADSTSWFVVFHIGVLLSYIAHFFGGAFFVNAIPHFTNGVSGRRFPSPFASPPGRGASSATVNVLWGSLNIAFGYLLVFRVGTFDFRRIQDVLIVGAGGLLMAVMLSRAFAGREGGK
jgi:hypothetical protein